MEELYQKSSQHKAHHDYTTSEQRWVDYAMRVCGLILLLSIVGDLSLHFDYFCGRNGFKAIELFKCA
jgi:hypothetical protein